MSDKETGYVYRRQGACTGERMHAQKRVYIKRVDAQESVGINGPVDSVVSPSQKIT